MPNITYSETVYTGDLIRITALCMRIYRVEQRVAYQIRRINFNIIINRVFYSDFTTKFNNEQLIDRLTLVYFSIFTFLQNIQ